MTMERSEVVIGTYENIILGFKVTKSFQSDSNPYSLETSFTDDAHRGALRCMAISPNGVLASCSTDDSIRLHSLRKRKEIGGLFEHNGTVNCIAFHDRSFMFSASEDGKICVWKSKNWELLRTLKGHKAQVMSVAIHPSGKLALSVGSDKSLLTWDLVTGKLAFQRKLKDAAQQIIFTDSGNHYILVYHRAFEVCAIEDTQVVKETEMTWRINAFCHIKGDFCAVGGDDRHVFIINILSGDKVLTLDMAESSESSFAGRVRSIRILNGPEDGCFFVFVGTSSGDIKAFDINVSEGEESSDEVLHYAAGARLTCMAVYSHAMLSNDKDTKSPKEQMDDLNEATEEDLVEASNEQMAQESYDEESDEDHNQVIPDQNKKRKKRPASKKPMKKDKAEAKVQKVKSPDAKSKKRKLK